MESAAVRSESRRFPAAPIALAAGLAVVGVLSVWLGWSSWLPEIEYDIYAAVQDSNAVNAAAILAGFLCIVSALLVLARAKIASFAAIAFGSAALGAVILLLPTPFPMWIFDSLTDSSPWMLPIQMLLQPHILWVYFIAALSLAYLAWLAIVRNPDWFSIVPSGEPNARAYGDWRRTVGVIFLSALVWFLLRSYGPMSIIAMALPFEPLGMSAGLDGVLSFFASVAVLITLLNERAEVDDEGVRITLAPTGWTLFRTPWSRVGRVDIVRHETKSPSATIRRSVLGIPIAFSIHARRYVNGEKLIDAIKSRAAAGGKRVQEWFVTDNAHLMAILLVACGTLAIVYMRTTQQMDWIEMSKTNYPPANFGSIASPLYYGFLQALAMACFGSALGILSAFHSAGFRPLLLVLYLLATRYITPDSVIHWLVWMAIFSMYLAMPGQSPDTIVSHPTWQEWNWGMGLSDYAPVIGAGFYVLAVVLASRRLKSGST